MANHGIAEEVAAFLMQREPIHRFPPRLWRLWHNLCFKGVDSHQHRPSSTTFHRI
jgi:hypothetical protein